MVAITFFFFFIRKMVIDEKYWSWKLRSLVDGLEWGFCYPGFHAGHTMKHKSSNKDLPTSVGSCLCSFPLWNNIAASSSSVVYMCCSWDIFRTLMVQFWKEGVELEDYVFFFIDLFAEGLDSSAPIRPWFRGDQEDYAARNAFRVRQYALSLLSFKGCSLMQSDPVN